MTRLHNDFDPITGLDWETLDPCDFNRWCYGKGGGSAPAAPDPAATAAAQAQANKEAVRESALVNQINQITPYGRVSYMGELGGTNEDGSPTRSMTLTLPDQVQRALEGQQAVTGGLTEFARQFVPRVADSLSVPFNTANIGQRPEYNEGTRGRVEQALFDRLQPQFDRDQAALDTRLANQGIGIGSEAYRNAQDDLSRGRTDARLAAVNQAGAEAQRDFGLQQQSYGQAISDALLNRGQGLNEVSALIQGAPAINTPSAPQPAQYQIAPPDILGANALNYQGQLNAYNQNQANNRAAMGGLFGLGSAALGAGLMPGGFLMSDRRLKRDIRKVGAMDDGTPVYTYRYSNGGPVRMGVMAQDILETHPEAVHKVEGFYAVDYGAL